MSMFCYQCQETAKNEGCTIAGVCGKKARHCQFAGSIDLCFKGNISSC